MPDSRKRTRMRWGSSALPKVSGEGTSRCAWSGCGPLFMKCQGLDGAHAKANSPRPTQPSVWLVRIRT